MIDDARLVIGFDRALGGALINYHASDEVLKEIAQEFGAVQCHALKADFDLKRAHHHKSVVSLSLSLSLDVTQECAINLLPFQHILTGSLTVQIIRRSDISDEIKEIGAKELGLSDLDEPDVVDGHHIELGHYIIELIGEIYDPYARMPGAVFVEPEENKAPTAFFALSKLIKP